jgi:hypothetical protein
MADLETVRAWVVQRSAQDDRLYEKYGKVFEAEHRGEFVAISDDGQTILGTDELKVAQQALRQFGSGAFALRRIGADAEIRWRRVAS